MTNTEKQLQFLKEYEILVRKYQTFIGSCGCCSSPFLVEGENELDYTDHMNHLRSEMY